MNRSTHRIWISTLMVLVLLTACSSPSGAPTGGAAPVATLTALSIPATAPSQTPPAATLPSATPAADNPSAGAGVTQTPEAALPGATASPAATTGANSGAAAGSQYTLVATASEARYRIREQLVNVDLPNDAIGKTKQISGSIVLKSDGTIDSAASKFSVNVDSLQSDRSQRDNFVRRNVLNTSQYPEVVFVPKEVTGLPNPLPQTGAVNFKITGDLTIKDVTKPVTWDVTGTVAGDQATGTAKTSFTFADFNLNQPRVPVVLSVEDHITLEVDLTLQREPGGTAAGAAPAANSSGDVTTAVEQPSTLAAECAVPAELTPAMTEGPYFKSGSPESTALVPAQMPGTRLHLTGYVLTTDCKPVVGALLDFWQADAQGQYDNTGYTLRGHQLTDAAGRYQLDTVIPGLYPGRTEHIHVKVQPQGGQVLTTQLYFPDVAQNQGDGIFDPRLLVKLSDAQAGKLATYNFIVAP